MKVIGLLGGMSWESTALYYQIINETTKQRFGGLHSARVCLRSVDFAPIESLQQQGDWVKLAAMLAAEARAIEAGGAECLLICTNTMHKVADTVAAAINIPLLHIADATAQVLRQDGVRKVGLLGTRFTMEQDFYKGRLTEQFGLEVITPDAAQRQTVHEIIYQELCQGEVKAESCEKYLSIIAALHQQGAEAVILGCTEIGMLVQQADTTVPLYDTTRIHAEQAVAWAVG